MHRYVVAGVSVGRRWGSVAFTHGRRQGKRQEHLSRILSSKLTKMYQYSIIRTNKIILFVAQTEIGRGRALSLSGEREG